MQNVDYLYTPYTARHAPRFGFLVCPPSYLYPTFDLPDVLPFTRDLGYTSLLRCPFPPARLLLLLNVTLRYNDVHLPAAVTFTPFF